MKTMKRGLVIGKFWPPHKGHNYLIEYAAKRVDHLDILVCDHPDFTIPAEQRANWLQTMHPGAKVQIIPDLENDDDSELWAAYTTTYLGYTPDVVFSSEDYGPVYAECMGSDHVMVDKPRKHIPISARYIRKDRLAHWQFLPDEVKQALCYRICVVGAESTGTTTLSMALAKHYRAPWVPEFGRTYTEALQFQKTDWTNEEFLHIAHEQQRMEDDLARRSDGLLICDTNTFATQLWEERYMGATSSALFGLEAPEPDLYILTDVNIPFEQDGIRDGEHIRHAMHQRFIEALDTRDVPYVIVTGTRNQRLKAATKKIDELLKGKTL